jgi:hypothetical protein
MSAYNVTIQNQVNRVTVQENRITVQLANTQARVVSIAAQGPPGPPAEDSIIVTAGTGGLPAFRVVYLTTSGTAMAAAASNVTHADRIVGMTTAAIAEGQNGVVRRTGQVENPAWSLEPGRVYFLGEGGEISTAVPSAGFVLIVGVPMSETKLVLAFGLSILR